MRSKRASIVFGGIVLGSLLLLLAQIVLAATQAQPPLPHDFSGQVTVGGSPGSGVEIAVKVREGNKLLTLELSPRSVKFASGDGTFGRHDLFAVPGDNHDTPERDGAFADEPLHFFLVATDVTGDSAPKTALIVDPLKRVDLSLSAPAPSAVRGETVPVEINVKPNGIVDRVEVVVNFITGDCRRSAIMGHI